MNNFFEIGLVSKISTIKSIDEKKSYMTIVLQNDTNAYGRGTPIDFIGKKALIASRKISKNDIVLIYGKVINTRDGLHIRGDSFKILEHLSHGKYLSQTRLEESFNESLPK